MGRILNVLSANGLSLAQESKRQVLALDSEFEDLEAQITTLNAENLQLQAEVNPLKRKVEQLTEQIQRMKAKAADASSNVLDENAEKLLFGIANNVRVTDGGAQTLIGGGTPAQVDYYLGLLRRRGFIRFPMSYAGENRYRATHDGLAYLHEKGLL